jgi:nitrate reductase gamma subunit
MRTRLIVIGAFVCAAIVPAILAAALYTQARHVPCVWSAQNCGLLNNVLSAGAVMRGSAVVLLVQGAARLTLTLWRWRAHEQIKWLSLCVDAILLLLFVAVAWGLSQSALDAYARYYSTVPADIPLDARKLTDFNKGLDKAMFDAARLAALFVWAAGLETAICVCKVWEAFDVEQLDHEIAVHEEHWRHEHPDALR